MCRVPSGTTDFRKRYLLYHNLTVIELLACHRDVYSLCVAHPEPMADRLYAETKHFLIDHVAKLLNEVQDGEESMLIRRYHKCWEDYSTGAGYLHSLFLYLNQQHIKTQKLSDAEIIYGGSDTTGGTSSNALGCVRVRSWFVTGDQMEIGELALEIWKTGLITPIGKRLVKFLLEAVDQDRHQCTILPIEAVRGTILSFVEVCIKFKIITSFQALLNQESPEEK